MKKNVQWMLGLFLLSFALWSVLGRMHDQEDLKKNGILVNAKIMNFFSGIHGLKGGYECSFEYDGRTIIKNSTTSYNGNFYILVGKSFPAIFSNKNGILEILITRQDFEKFKMSYPDSLRWVSLF